MIETVEDLYIGEERKGGIEIIPETAFPIIKRPDVSELRDRLNWLKKRSKTRNFTEFDRLQIVELIRNLKEIERRMVEDYIYYMIPNPCQMKFVRSVCYGRILVGGNKLGKTEILLYDYILKCLGKHPAQDRKLFSKPPVSMRVICSDFGSGIKLKMLPLAQKLIPPYEIERYDGDNYCMYFKNASLLEFKSNEQIMIKFGMVDRHSVGADEPFRREIFGENMARLVATNGNFDITQTPDWTDRNPWIKVDILPKTREWPNAGTSGMTMIHGTYKDNLMNLDPKGVQKWIEGMTEAEKPVRLDGRFPVGVSFLFADRFVDGVHSCQPFRIHKSRLKFRGIDLAGMSAPVVCLWGFIGNYEDRYGVDNIAPVGKKPILYIYREYYKRGRTIPENAQVIITLTGKEEIQLTFIDPKSGSVKDEKTGMTREMQWADEGIFAVRGTINLQVGLEALASMMAIRKDNLTDKGKPKEPDSPSIVIFTSCEETIKELKNATVTDLEKVDALHCISILRWMASAKLLQNWAGISARIPGAVYGGKESQVYRKQHQGFQRDREQFDLKEIKHGSVR